MGFQLSQIIIYDSGTSLPQTFAYRSGTSTTFLHTCGSDRILLSFHQPQSVAMGFQATIKETKRKRYSVSTKQQEWDNRFFRLATSKEKLLRALCRYSGEEGKRDGEAERKKSPARKNRGRPIAKKSTVVLSLA